MLDNPYFEDRSFVEKVRSLRISFTKAKIKYINDILNNPIQLITSSCNDTTSNNIISDFEKSKNYLETELSKTIDYLSLLISQKEQEENSDNYYDGPTQRELDEATLAAMNGGYLPDEYIFGNEFDDD